ncbi:hypothetical protein Ais01nite_02450 [Asanoa ishikariensis]|nr:hypothetical protein Ais01nite_02450 [Asanoa ishikariensis]
MPATCAAVAQLVAAPLPYNDAGAAARLGLAAINPILGAVLYERILTPVPVRTPGRAGRVRRRRLGGRSG